MKLAAVQFAPPKARPDLARPALCALIREAMERGADLVVCPEMATTGYVFTSPEQLADLAETADGATFHAVSALCAAFGATATVGFAERCGDVLYNSCLTIGPDGKLLSVYRKVLLFELDESWATPGTQRAMFDVPGVGTVAPAICMDLNDDGFTDFCRTAHPSVVAFCSNWLDQGSFVPAYWAWRMSRWRGWFVGANRWGQDAGVPFRGESAILGPGGLPFAIAPVTGDAVLVVDTDKPSRWASHA